MAGEIIVISVEKSGNSATARVLFLYDLGVDLVKNANDQPIVPTPSSELSSEDSLLSLTTPAERDKMDDGSMVWITRTFHKPPHQNNQGLLVRIRLEYNRTKAIVVDRFRQKYSNSALRIDA